MKLEKPLTYDTWRVVKCCDNTTTNIDGPDHYVFEGLIYTPYIPAQILNEPAIWDHGVGELEEVPQHWLDPDNMWAISSRGLRRRLLTNDFFSAVMPTPTAVLPFHFVYDFTLDYNKWDIKKPITFETWRTNKLQETIYITMNVNPYIVLNDNDIE